MNNYTKIEVIPSFGKDGIEDDFFTAVRPGFSSILIPEDYAYTEDIREDIEELKYKMELLKLTKPTAPIIQAIEGLSTNAKWWKNYYNLTKLILDYLKDNQKNHFQIPYTILRNFDPKWAYFSRFLLFMLSSSNNFKNYLADHMSERITHELRTALGEAKDITDDPIFYKKLCDYLVSFFYEQYLKENEKIADYFTTRILDSFAFHYNIWVHTKVRNLKINFGLKKTLRRLLLKYALLKLKQKGYLIEANHILDQFKNLNFSNKIEIESPVTTIRLEQILLSQFLNDYDSDTSIKTKHLKVIDITTSDLATQVNIYLRKNADAFCAYWGIECQYFKQTFLNRYSNQRG
jgi:hypothetical protein